MSETGNRRVITKQKQLSNQRPPQEKKKSLHEWLARSDLFKNNSKDLTADRGFTKGLLRVKSWL